MLIDVLKKQLEENPSLVVHVLRKDVESTIHQLEQADRMREALEWYADQMCEGYCQGKDPKTCAFIGSDNCSGCPAVVALNQAKGEV